MPISTTWYDDEHRVILQQFDGKWTWEDATNELAVMNGLASSVSHNIVLFSDLSHTSLIPQGNIMARGRSIINQIPHNATPSFLSFSRG